MKYPLAAIAASLVLSVTSVIAQDDAPVYDNGPVWDLRQVETKDGHFNDYMRWLATDWRRQEEALKKAGLIVSYHVYLVQNPRAGEPDILLAQEYKNMAAFDTPTGQQYALRAKVAGSIAKADQQQEARSSLRNVLGDMMIREAILR